jgi:broad specificity phosphatase PhoE
MAHTEIVLVRHGETGWTLSGQHTSRTDVPLTDRGRQQAAQLASRLTGRDFTLVLTSPMSRATDTCALAGFAAKATSDADLMEWDYGDYEGRTTADIQSEIPDWSLWRDGVPGGETKAEVTRRADRVLDRLRATAADALVFSHGHFLRVLATRWLGLDAADGRLFLLRPASISVLGWEREQEVLALWNDAAD